MQTHRGGRRGGARGERGGWRRRSWAPGDSSLRRSGPGAPRRQRSGAGRGRARPVATQAGPRLATGRAPAGGERPAALIGGRGHGHVTAPWSPDGLPRQGPRWRRRRAQVSGDRDGPEPEREPEPEPEPRLEGLSRGTRSCPVPVLRCPVPSGLTRPGAPHGPVRPVPFGSVCRDRPRALRPPPSCLPCPTPSVLQPGPPCTAQSGLTHLARSCRAPPVARPAPSGPV